MGRRAMAGGPNSSDGTGYGKDGKSHGLTPPPPTRRSAEPVLNPAPIQRNGWRLLVLAMPGFQ